MAGEDSQAEGRHHRSLQCDDFQRLSHIPFAPVLIFVLRSLRAMMDLEVDCPERGSAPGCCVFRDVAGSARGVQRSRQRAGGPATVRPRLSGLCRPSVMLTSLVICRPPDRPRAALLNDTLCRRPGFYVCCEYHLFCAGHFLAPLIVCGGGVVISSFRFRTDTSRTRFVDFVLSCFRVIRGASNL